MVVNFTLYYYMHLRCRFVLDIIVVVVVAVIVILNFINRRLTVISDRIHRSARIIFVLWHYYNAYVDIF